MADPPHFPRKGIKRKASVPNYQNTSTKSVKKKKRYVNVEHEIPQHIQNLNEKTILKDMVILCCITEVRKTCLKVALPGCLVGIVPSNNISSSFNALLQSNNIQVLEPLHSIFSVGQSLQCKIVDTIKSEKKCDIIVSINPHDVNEDLKKSSFFKNMIINAAVKSIEDQGYIMDIGLNIPGFINKSDVKTKLKIGQVIQARVLDVSDLKPVLSLAINNKPVKLQESYDYKLSCFRPGMYVDAIVQNVKKQGLILNVMGFVGCVCMEHIKNSIEPKIQVTGTVLFVHPISCTIYLTLNKVPVLNVFKWKRWDMIENALSIGIRKDSVLFKLDKNVKCEAMKWELCDVKIDDFNKFSVGTIHI